MSGGNYNYMYGSIEDQYVGRMYDKELDKMMKDLCQVLYELEWWQSGDTGEERYRNAVKDFKRKYFKADGRYDNLKEIIEEEIHKLKTELFQMLD